jgi:ankyrin repeat protein
MHLTFSSFVAGDESGVAPLHLAVLRQRRVVVSTLLDYHADPNPRMKDSYTPLHILLHFFFPSFLIN